MMMSSTCDIHQHHQLPVHSSGLRCYVCEAKWPEMYLLDALVSVSVGSVPFAMPSSVPCFDV